MRVYSAGVNVAEKFAPHYCPSLNLHYNDSDHRISSIISQNESYNDSIQIIKDIISIKLIDSAVTKLQNSARATDDITTRLEQTSAYDKLLQFYRIEVYSRQVQQRSLNTGILILYPKILIDLKITIFIKPPAKTISTFKMIKRVNSSEHKHPIRRIRLLTDYHTLIPLIIDNLPL